MLRFLRCRTRLGSAARRALLLLVLALTAGCTQAAVATPAPTVITIAGATAMRPVLEELAAAFSRRNPNVQFDLRGGGSTVGIERLAAGAADLAASTLLAPQASSATPDPAAGFSRIPVGVDGVAVVVHATNPITQVTGAQLGDLYSGRIFDWQELGGEPGEVILVSREDGSGTRLAFENRVMADEDVSLTAVVMPGSADVVEFVGRNPQAIGYVSRAFVTSVLAAQTPDSSASAALDSARLRVLAVDGLLPTDEAITAQSYPIIQPLYLVSRRTPSDIVRQFLDFTLSPAGQTIVGRHHVRVR